MVRRREEGKKESIKEEKKAMPSLFPLSLSHSHNLSIAANNSLQLMSSTEDGEGGYEAESFNPQEWNGIREYFEQTCTKPLIVQKVVCVDGDNMLPHTYTTVHEWSDPEQLASDIHAEIVRRMKDPSQAALGEVGNASFSFFNTDEPNAGDDVVLISFDIIVPKVLPASQAHIESDLWERLRGFWNDDKRFVHPQPKFRPSKMFLARQARRIANSQPPPLPQ
jgi:hypothetical protein